MKSWKHGGVGARTDTVLCKCSQSTNTPLMSSVPGPELRAGHVDLRERMESYQKDQKLVI